jgi:hypothetical protein
MSNSFFGGMGMGELVVTFMVVLLLLDSLRRPPRTPPSAAAVVTPRDKRAKATSAAPGESPSRSLKKGSAPRWEPRPLAFASGARPESQAQRRRHSRRYVEALQRRRLGRAATALEHVSSYHHGGGRRGLRGSRPPTSAADHAVPA